MPDTATLLQKTKRRGASADGRFGLVEEERGRNVGRYLKAKGLIPALVFAAPLKRTVNTAKLAIEEMGGRHAAGD